jgi:hypothetical protein
VIVAPRRSRDNRRWRWLADIRKRRASLRRILKDRSLQRSWGGIRATIGNSRNNTWRYTVREGLQRIEDRYFTVHLDLKGLAEENRYDLSTRLYAWPDLRAAHNERLQQVHVGHYGALHDIERPEGGRKEQDLSAMGTLQCGQVV